MIYAKSKYSNIATKIKLAYDRNNKPYTSFTIRDAIKNSTPKSYVYINCVVWGEHLNLQENSSEEQRIIIDTIDTFGLEYYNGKLQYKITCHASVVEPIADEFEQATSFTEDVSSKSNISDDDDFTKFTEDFNSDLPFDL